MHCRDIEQHSNLLASQSDACTSVPSHPSLYSCSPSLDGRKRKCCNRHSTPRENMKTSSRNNKLPPTFPTSLKRQLFRPFTALWAGLPGVTPKSFPNRQLSPPHQPSQLFHHLYPTSFSETQQDCHLPSADSPRACVRSQDPRTQPAAGRGPKHLRLPVRAVLNDQDAARVPPVVLAAASRTPPV